MATKFRLWVPIHIAFWWPFNHVALRDHLKNFKIEKLNTYRINYIYLSIYLSIYTCIYIYYISTSTRPITTKHYKVATYLKGLLPINSHNPLNIWSRDVQWQIINIISPLSKYLWSPNLSGWWHTARSFHSLIRMNPQYGGLVRSSEKLITLYLHLLKIQGHQTKQGPDWGSHP